MSINATLRRLVISSPQVARLAGFYKDSFGFAGPVNADEWRGDAQERSLWIRPGAANQLLEAHFVFPDVAAMDAFVGRLRDSDVAYIRSPNLSERPLTIEDPDGRRVCFDIDDRKVGASNLAASTDYPACLQHYAVRTPAPQVLLEFYSQKLGFVVSDLVRDDAGDLTAAFLRSDAHHHSLAIFRAAERRLDHFSCETHNWHMLRNWADYMASRSIPLAWGVGRHGPGNDTFFMVYDPDGNLAEVSSDLELCTDERPVGTWKHCMQTLNQWGVAIMRS